MCLKYGQSQPKHAYYARAYKKEEVCNALSLVKQKNEEEAQRR